MFNDNLLLSSFKMTVLNRKVFQVAIQFKYSKMATVMHNLDDAKTLSE